jgi:hypothetical protein
LPIWREADKKQAYSLKKDFRKQINSFGSLFLFAGAIFSFMMSMKNEKMYLLLIALDRLYAIIKLLEINNKYRRRMRNAGNAIYDIGGLKESRR